MEQRCTLYLTGGQRIEELFDPRLTCLPGRVAVIEDRTPKRGSLYLPVSGRINADTGTVIASGVDELPVGSRVGMLPGHGIYITNWLDSGWDMRMFGVSESWYLSVPCQLDDTNDVRLFPTYDWCLVKREKIERQILTPDVSAWRDWEQRGELVAKGPSADFAMHSKGGVLRLEGQTFPLGEVSLGDDVRFEADMNAAFEEQLVTFRYDCDPALALVRYGLLRAKQVA